MALPDAVIVGPHAYRVVSSEECDAHLEGADSSGRTLPGRLEIAVHSTLPPTAAAEVLLHEVLHAIWDMTPLGDDEGREERTIQALTPWLLDVLRRNPDLVEMLTA